MHHHNKLPNYCAETCEMRWNVKNLLSHQSCFSEAYPFLLQRYLAYKSFFYLSGFASNWSLLDVVRLCLPSPVCVSCRNPTFLLSTPLKPSFGQRCFLPSSQALYSTQALWDHPLRKVPFVIPCAPGYWPDLQLLLGLWPLKPCLVLLEF